MKRPNLTKQGVRDLGSSPRPKRHMEAILMQCMHPRMKECHQGCGHYTCPDCGLTWDRAAGAS